MNKYVAFLRGINVSGQKIIKMEALSRMFASMGFSGVKTYIQSGNVIFESSESAAYLTETIEKNLHVFLGYDVTVLLRTMSAIEEIVKQNPFKEAESNNITKLYVTFMSEELPIKVDFPIISPRNDVEIFQITNRNAFSISRQQNGKFGFPNIFIEKEFKILSTTRNWTTVCKVISL
jgi:uncharacterized protein (DUF1697 family)